MEERRCLSCQWMRDTEEGYSSWTITGCQHECMFGLILWDDDQAEAQCEAANRTAETCEFFTEGTRLTIAITEDEGEPEASIRDWIKLHRCGG